MASNIIKESINNSEPLGLLILTHRRHEMDDDLWHWVTIVGYEEGKKGIDIIFLDCGEIKRISAGIVFENNRFNIVKMVRFFYK
ncbi:hypothetical protein [Thomasclavelia cocleata]|uniref:hypothetical protein n=1 Tax=Thomasclavelia cocleata TaxID=69824 RepID=UPI00257562F3|nr:hypothetical protein [Thomasclavelia cocleata]